MSTKTHLATSQEPIQEGSEVEALCGEELKRVRFRLSYDGDFLPEIHELVRCMNVCRKCRNGQFDGRYL